MLAAAIWPSAKRKRDAPVQRISTVDDEENLKPRRRGRYQA